MRHLRGTPREVRTGGVPTCPPDERRGFKLKEKDHASLASCMALEPRTELITMRILEEIASVSTPASDVMYTSVVSSTWSDLNINLDSISGSGERALIMYR